MDGLGGGGGDKGRGLLESQLGCGGVTAKVNTDVIFISTEAQKHT